VARAKAKAKAKAKAAPIGGLPVAYLTARQNIALAQVAFANVLGKLARAIARAAKERDEHAMLAVAVSASKLTEALEQASGEVDTSLWLGAEVAAGRNWSYLGKLLSMLADAHAAEVAKRANGATGIAHFRAALVRDGSPLGELVSVYDDMAKLASATNGRLPDGRRWGPPLDDLLRAAFLRPGLGLETLRQKPDPTHPLANLVANVFGSMTPVSPEAEMGPGSLHGKHREYLRGPRRR
jgi:hypothetical protein